MTLRASTRVQMLGHQTLTSRSSDYNVLGRTLSWSHTTSRAVAQAEGGPSRDMVGRGQVDP